MCSGILFVKGEVEGLRYGVYLNDVNDWLKVYGLIYCWMFVLCCFEIFVCVFVILLEFVVLFLDEVVYFIELVVGRWIEVWMIVEDLC